MKFYQRKHLFRQYSNHSTSALSVKSVFSVTSQLSMSRLLKYTLVMLKLIGLCSLKSTTSKGRHGWIYHLWSLLVSLMFWLEIMTMDVSPSILLGLIFQSFVYNILKLHALFSDNLLVDILNGFDSFDFKLCCPVVKNKSKWKVFLVTWLSIHSLKIFRIILTYNTRVGVNLFTLVVCYCCIPILAIEFYRHISIRLATISHFLYLKTIEKNISSEALTVDIENMRSLYLYLHRLTSSVNCYLGVPLFGVILSLNLDFYTRIYVLFYHSDEVTGFKLVITFPAEFMLIFYLTMITDSIVDQVSFTLKVNLYHVLYFFITTALAKHTGPFL